MGEKNLYLVNSLLTLPLGKEVRKSMNRHLPTNFNHSPVKTVLEPTEVRRAWYAVKVSMNADERILRTHGLMPRFAPALVHKNPNTRHVSGR